MTPDILTCDYSTQDAAFALEHGNLGDFRRNLVRGDFLVLPRKSFPGRAGGDYRFGHLLEMALQMHIGAATSREVAKSAIWAGFKRLMGNDMGCAKLNALSSDDRQAVLCGSDFSPEEDPYKLKWFVECPHLVLNSDFISREEKNPTFWVFTPLRVGHSGEIIMLNGTATLADAYHRVVSESTVGAGDDFTRQSIIGQCNALCVINVTQIINRLEYLLAIRLRARKPIGA